MTERKAGHFLADMKAQNLLSKGGGDQKSDHPKHNVEGDKPTLKELGVEKDESKRWQRIAGIPEDPGEVGFQPVLASNKVSINTTKEIAKKVKSSHSTVEKAAEFFRDQYRTGYAVLRSYDTNDTNDAKPTGNTMLPVLEGLSGSFGNLAENAKALANHTPEPAGGTLSSNEQRVDRPPLSETGKTIKRIFDENHPVGLSPDYIGGRMGVDGNDILPALRVLKTDGYVSVDRDGVWRWMP